MVVPEGFCSGMCGRHIEGGSKGWQLLVGNLFADADAPPASVDLVCPHCGHRAADDWADGNYLIYPLAELADQDSDGDDH